MATAVQVQSRRGTSSQVASFTGVAGEVVVDTTNNRVVVQDGSTAGGWPMAGAARVAVNDTNFTLSAPYATVAYTAITAPRTVSLPASTAYPLGQRLLVVDESGSCSGTNTITLAANGTDTIGGAAAQVINSAFGYFAIETNGAGKWTIVGQVGGASTSSYVGMVNKFRNGTMDVWQRGTSSTSPPVATSINTATSTSGATATMSLTVPAGALVVVLVTENAGTIGTASDATNGSYTLATSIAFNSAGDVGGVFYFANSAALSSVTLTYTKHASGSVAMSAFYVTGMATSSVLDTAVTASATGSSTSPSVTGGTPTALNELVIGVAFCVGAPTYTQPSGFSTPPTSVSVSTTLTAAGGSQYVIGTGTTTFAPTLGTSEAWAAIIVGFQVKTISTAGAYVPDGWIVLPTGAGATACQAGGRLLTKNSLAVYGGGSVTDIIVKQRIESLIAAALCSQTVTVQAKIYNNTGGAITPTLTVKHAASQDNWTSPTTDVSAANLQACANGAWTQVAYTFTASANSYNGLEIGFDFGSNFSSAGKYIQITECDIRVTPGANAGQNPSPPLPELRPIAAELPFCQRYLAYIQAAGAYQGYATGGYQTSTAFYGVLDWPVTMRVAPTVTFSAASTFSMFNFGVTISSLSSAVSSINFMFLQVIVSGATAGQFGILDDGGNVNSSIKASAEL